MYPVLVSRGKLSFLSLGEPGNSKLKTLVGRCFLRVFADTSWTRCTPEQLRLRELADSEHHHSMADLEFSFQGKISILVEGSQCIAVKSLPITLESIRELQILRAAQGHPNVIELLRATVTMTQVILYMEHHPRTLLDLISEFPDGLPLSRVRVIFHQILSGLTHIHRIGYVHHDLKLENILIDGDDHVYLIDFGLSQPYTPGRYDSCHDVGSAHYAAPEIWLRKPYEGPEVDVWAAGVCLFLLVTGFFPFGGSTTQEIWHSIQARVLWKNDTLEKIMLLFDLLQRMLQFDHKHRFSLIQISQHPWLRCSGKLSLGHSKSSSSLDA